jgi:hypothetical protein
MQLKEGYSNRHIGGRIKPPLPIIDRYRKLKRVPQFKGSQELEEMHLEDQTRPSKEDRTGGCLENYQ